MAILHHLNQQFLTDKEMSSNVNAVKKGTSKAPVKYTGVGIGKPLCVQIVTIYVGDAPKRVFRGKPDLLLASGVKCPATFEASQRAINLIEKKTQNRTYLEPASAFAPGTTVVYYTPALQESEMSFSFELCAETFSDENIQALKNLFLSASKMPIFVASSHLIAGATVLNIVAKLGKSVFKAKPFLKDTLAMRVDIGGFRNFVPGVKLICDDKHVQFFKDHCNTELDSHGGEERYHLVEKATGKRYEGEYPYLLVNVDGKERRDLNSFEPKLATAAILSRFYGEDQSTATYQVLESALQLKNDLTFVGKIKDLQKELDKHPANSKEHREISRLIATYKKNILTADLREFIK